MAAGQDDTTITVKRPLLADLHAAQAQMGAQAGRPITLADALRQLLDFWRAGRGAAAGRTEAGA